VRRWTAHPERTRNSQKDSQKIGQKDSQKIGQKDSQKIGQKNSRHSHSTSRSPR
jgi:hypothetical protein